MFKNRAEAGIKLAGLLKKYKGSGAVVITIGKSGVPAGYEIANALSLPLDMIWIKKIGHPIDAVFGAGAVAVYNRTWEDIPLNGNTRSVSRVTSRLEGKCMERENILYADIENRPAIIVDDICPTGKTMLGAIDSIKKLSPSKIIAAVPVISAAALKKLSRSADEVFYLELGENLKKGENFYADFKQPEDKEVISAIRKYIKSSFNLYKSNN
jgi:predicted phosphoribosyltransferase